MGLGGGCLVPIAAHATIEGDAMTLSGLVARPDGSEVIRDRQTGLALEADLIGRELAGKLLERGAARILAN